MSVAGPAAQSIDLGRPAVSPGHVETRPLHPADSPTMHCSLTQFIELTALHVCHCVFCVVAVVSRAGEMAGRPLCCCGLRDGSGGGRASSTGQRIAKHTRHTRHRQQQQSQGQGQAGPGWTRLDQARNTGSGPGLLVLHFAAGHPKQTGWGAVQRA